MAVDVLFPDQAILYSLRCVRFSGECVTIPTRRLPVLSMSKQPFWLRAGGAREPVGTSSSISGEKESVRGETVNPSATSSELGRMEHNIHRNEDSVSSSSLGWCCLPLGKKVQAYVAIDDSFFELSLMSF